MFWGKDSYKKDLQTAYDSVVGRNELAKKRILITGATGLIGSFLVDLLLFANEVYETEIEIYALGRDLEKLKRRFASHLDCARLHLVVQDVVAPLHFEEQLDFIIHAAGDGYPAAFREHPVETMTPALIGTYQLLEYARHNAVRRFLFVSSGEVYGMRSGFLQAFREDEDLRMRSMQVRECYPEAKRAAEVLCASFYQQYALETVVTRLSHIYGAGGTAGDNRASVQFLQRAAKGEPIELYSEGKQVRSYTYVADAVSGILTVLLQGKTGQAYNVANRNSVVSIAEFAKCMANIAGVNCVFKLPDQIQSKEQSPIEYAVLDSSKLEELGWIGKYAIEQGIARMYKLERK